MGGGGVDFQVTDRDCIYVVLLEFNLKLQFETLEWNYKYEILMKLPRILVDGVLITLVL